MKMRRQVLRWIWTLATLSAAALPMTAWAGGPTDPFTLIDARRKAKDDPAARANATLDWVLAVARDAKVKMRTEMFPGIKEKLNLAATDIQELKAAKGGDDAGVVQLVERLKATLTEVQGIVDYIKVHKLESVAMPADTYSGADKAKIRAAVQAHWKQTYPDDKVLAVRLPNK